MGAHEECWKKTHVKIDYIPPTNRQQPADCQDIKLTKPPGLPSATWPQIWFNPDLPGPYKDPALGAKLLCAVPTIANAGGIILLVQVTAYVVWEVGFFTKQNQHVTEIHRVRFSIPTLMKIEGPRAFFMAVVAPAPIKLLNYMNLIVAGIKKLKEAQDLIGQISPVIVQSSCPGHTNVLEEILKALERKLKRDIEMRSRGYTLDIAKDIKNSRTGEVRFAGSRLA